MESPNVQRRAFLATVGMIAGQTAVEAAPLVSFLGGQNSATQAEREVLKVVSSYGSHLEINRKMDSVEVSVKMKSPQDFVRVYDPLKPLPFEGIQVKENNTLSFVHQGVNFTLRHTA